MTETRAIAEHHTQLANMSLDDILDLTAVAKVSRSILIPKEWSRYTR